MAAQDQKMKSIIAVITLYVILYGAFGGVCLANPPMETEISSATCCSCQGPSGIPGVPGIPGTPGHNGIQGPKGDSGQSFPGRKGEIGDRGQQGPRGLQGAPGKAGPQGHRGLQGAPGTAGPAGPMGENGAKGEAADPITANPPAGVYFSAYLNRHFQLGNEDDERDMIFQDVVTNIGNDYDAQTGRFTCRLPGAYFFTVSLMTIANTNRVYAALMKNDEIICSVHDSENRYYHQSSNSAVLVLAAGDTVYVQGSSTAQGAYGDHRHFSGFTGFLINAM